MINDADPNTPAGDPFRVEPPHPQARILAQGHTRSGSKSAGMRARSGQRVRLSYSAWSKSAKAFLKSSLETSRPRKST